MAVVELSLPRWRLKDFDVGAGEAARAFEAPLDGEGWIDIAAPGDVYLALHAAGRLPDPFGDRAEDDCAWVIDREWWQRADFEAPDLAPGQRLRLTF
jgi:beta-mannosidase